MKLTIAEDNIVADHRHLALPASQQCTIRLKCRASIMKSAREALRAKGHLPRSGKCQGETSWATAANQRRPSFPNCSDQDSVQSGSSSLQGSKRALRATKRTASPKLTLLLNHLMRARRCRGSRFPLPLGPQQLSHFRQKTTQTEHRLVHKR